MKIWMASRSKFALRNDPDSGWNLFFWRLRVAFQVIVSPTSAEQEARRKIDYGSNQGRAYDEYLPEKHIPLPLGLSIDEWLQRRMPSDNMGFALALAIVSGIFIGVLVLHWATKEGWV